MNKFILRFILIIALLFILILFYLPISSSSMKTQEENIPELETQATLEIFSSIPEEEEEFSEQADYEDSWASKYAQYPEATRVWVYMKENFGWSDTVCAGIMGNIMGEISGGSLDFSKWNWNKRTLGMFQWLGGRKTSIKKIYGNIPTIEEQLEFMYDELYGTDGVRQQVTDAQRKKILEGETPEKVAMAFCRYFERPGGSGVARKGYARKAYKYFTS